VKRQIQNMDPSFTGELSELNTGKELKQAENELALLQEKYSQNHPDVLKQQQRVNMLTKEMHETAGQEDISDQEAHEGNALYITLSGQLRSTQHKIDYLFEFKKELQEKIQELQANIEKTPLVEKQYLDLNRMRQTSLNKYAEMEAKYRAAKLAQTLEEEQKGETFTLIEPPIAPEKPEKPNRKKIAIMGLALSLGFGLGLTVLLELMNEVVRGPKALERITGMQPIVVIPYIETPLDRVLRSRRLKLILIISVFMFIAAIVLTHFFVMPLEIIWAKAMIKLGRL
jgi:capsular polysaccharide biosynthesis protein